MTFDSRRLPLLVLAAFAGAAGLAACQAEPTTRKPGTVGPVASPSQTRPNTTDPNLTPSDPNAPRVTLSCGLKAKASGAVVSCVDYAGPALPDAQKAPYVECAKDVANEYEALPATAPCAPGGFKVVCVMGTPDGNVERRSFDLEGSPAKQKACTDGGGRWGTIDANGVTFVTASAQGQTQAQTQPGNTTQTQGGATQTQGNTAAQTQGNATQTQGNAAAPVKIKALKPTFIVKDGNGCSVAKDTELTLTKAAVPAATNAAQVTIEFQSFGTCAVTSGNTVKADWSGL